MDTAKGLGASHQTGWTGLIADLLHPFKRKFHDPEKSEEQILIAELIFFRS